MLTIRSEQMRVLTDASMVRMIEDMMHRHFPRHCANLSSVECTQTVRQAMLKGRALGFEDAQLPAYVALEFSFGTGFPVNPPCPWAQEILDDRSLASAARMQRLRSKAIFYLAALAEATAPVASEAGS
jgi:hypothetical protein